jgi:hypothetical protein
MLLPLYAYSSENLKSSKLVQRNILGSLKFHENRSILLSRRSLALPQVACVRLKIGTIC